MEQKDHQIEELQSKIKKLETDLAKTDEKTQLMQQVAKEIAVQYPSVKSFSVVNMVYTNTKTLKSETKPTLFIESTPELTPEQQEEILKWLRVRLEEPKLMIK